MPPRGRPRKDGQPIRQSTPQTNAAAKKKPVKNLKTPERLSRKLANKKRPAAPPESEIRVALLPASDTVHDNGANGDNDDDDDDDDDNNNDDRTGNETEIADGSKNDETEDELVPADEDTVGPTPGRGRESSTLPDNDLAKEPDATPAPVAALSEPGLASAPASELPAARSAAPPRASLLVTRPMPGRSSGVNGSGSGRAGLARGVRSGGAGASLGYTANHVDLDAISYRQLSEDIDAYAADLDFCDAQLALPDLTPQEARTLQLRRLDLSHQIRYSRHRQESLEARRIVSGGRPFAAALRTPAMAAPAAAAAAAGGGAGSSPVRTTWVAMTGTEGSARRKPAAAKGKLKRMHAELAAAAEASSGPNKRARAGSELSVPDTISVHSGSSVNGAVGVGVGVGGDIHHVDDRSDAEEELDGYGYGHSNGHRLGNGLANGRANGLGHENGAGSGNGYGNGHATALSNGYSNGLGHGNEEGQPLQRLGFWKCRLCVSEKYLYAGPDRQPSAPSKWPLKDMGKLMSHYFDMHTEHDPEERCAELGAALDHNRGPFEYWLRKSRAQRIPDRNVMDEAIAQLLAGRVPQLLRNLCRAAAAFPSV